MIDADRALPGRDAEMPVAGRNAVLGTPMKPPFPEGMEQTSSAWAASGAPSNVLADPRRLHDGRRLRGRPHAQPHLRRGVQRPHRTHRGRAASSSTRSTSRYERAAAAVLGEPRPDPGHAPGQRRRHPVPLGDLHDSTPSSERGAIASRDTYAESSRRPGYGEITTEIAPRRTVLLRRGLPPAVPGTRTRGATADRGTGVSCPIGLGVPSQVQVAPPATA